MERQDVDVIGRGLGLNDSGVDNQQLININNSIRDHSVEVVGKRLRGYMGAMKRIL